MIYVFKLIDTTNEKEISSFVSKAGLLRTYKEIILTNWKKAALNNSFTEVHPTLADGRESKKIIGVYLKKNAWIDTNMVNSRIDVYGFDGKPDLMNDTDLASFLSKAALPMGVTPLKVVQAPTTKKKVALAAKKKTVTTAKKKVTKK